ncbi:hypothetical protein PS687_01607 [Pseudomonas fluorescens]|nr:hypothetical protein PS687_01607 [Pseudomonas fluorescens]
MAVLHANAPLVHRQAVGQAFVAATGHGEPGIGEAPAQGRVFLAVVHVPINALAVDFLDVFAEEFGDVFIGRPVHRYAEVVAVFFLELGFQLRTLEPVGAEPIEVGELLVGQLVDLAVRRGGERQADKVLEVEGRRGEVLAFVGHQVGDRFGLAVAKVRTDQVGIVDPAVIDVLVGLHLGLQLLHHVTFLQQVVGQLDAGDFTEGLGQHLGLVLMGGEGFRHHVDLHPTERFRRLDKPLQLFELLGFGEGGRFELAADPFLRGIFVRIGPGRSAQTAQGQYGGQ